MITQFTTEYSIISIPLPAHFCTAWKSRRAKHWLLSIIPKEGVACKVNVRLGEEDNAV